jgi:hypothetical protein
MIKFESKKRAVSLEAEGSVAELCTDVCMCINSVWQSINEKSNDIAESFKLAIQNAVKDGIMFVNTVEKEEKKDEDNDIDEVIGLLNKLLEVLKK